MTKFLVENDGMEEEGMVEDYMFEDDMKGLPFYPNMSTQVTDEQDVSLMVGQSPWQEAVRLRHNGAS